MANRISPNDVRSLHGGDGSKPQSEIPAEAKRQSEIRPENSSAATAKALALGQIKGLAFTEPQSAPKLDDIRDGVAQLKHGEQGPAVDHVQRMLNLPQSGVYDHATQAAVKQFQAQHGLPATGDVGPRTLGALEQSHRPPAPSLDNIRDGEARLKAGEQGPAADHVQRMLNMPQTGVYDHATQDAVRNFQAQHGLPQTGEVGPRTLRALEQAHRPPAPSLDNIRDGEARLKAGEQGPSVNHVQQMLNLPQTGVYDHNTQTAVKNFQAQHGLPQTGEVGPRTLRAMEHAHYPPAPSLNDLHNGTAKLHPGQTGPAVEHIQQLLNVRQTGVYDAATQAAVKQFQEDHGLHSNNGEVGKTTLHALEHPSHPPAPSLRDIENGSAKLHAGQQGPAVAYMQRLLNMPQTGIYDGATQAAVKRFQEAHELRSNSHDVGKQTLNAMEHACVHEVPHEYSSRHPQAPSLHDIHAGNSKLTPGEHGPAVEHLQRLLNMKPTGIYDKATQSAVERFQSAHGLHPATGVVGKQTMQALERSNVFAAHRQINISDSHAQGLLTGGTSDPARTQRIPTDSPIINNAQKYLGTPYGWGSKDTKSGSIDCSGFVDQVYRESGIKLPAGWSNDNSKDPSNNPSICNNEYMHHVDAQDAKPGDVVIFGNQHIGIYAGDVVDKSGVSHKVYIGANHGTGGQVDFTRVDTWPNRQHPNVVPQFYHPTAKALENA